MGAINYGSNNLLIQLGYNLSSKYKLIDCITEDLKNEHDDLSKDELENKTYDIWIDIVNDSYDDVNNFLTQSFKEFNWYDFKIESGYYEGFYISLDFKYLYIDNWKERSLMHKELTKIKTVFKELINNFGLVSYSPGWVTTFYDTNTSIKMLNNAVKSAREQINKIPTQSQFYKNNTKG